MKFKEGTITPAVFFTEEFRHKLNRLKFYIGNTKRLLISPHAKLRMRQRNISEKQIRNALKYGVLEEFRCKYNLDKRNSFNVVSKDCKIVVDYETYEIVTVMNCKGRQGRHLSLKELYNKLKNGGIRMEKGFSIEFKNEIAIVYKNYDFEGQETSVSYEPKHEIKSTYKTSLKDIMQLVNHIEFFETHKEVFER